jgi:hypothetical protein
VKEIQNRKVNEKKEETEKQQKVTGMEDKAEPDDVVREICRMPFLMLGLDLPPPPLFKDVMEKNIIPQVILSFINIISFHVEILFTIQSNNIKQSTHYEGFSNCIATFLYSITYEKLL